MKQLATISKTSVHAADTSVSAAQAKNPMDSANSQVNSSPAVTGKGLVWDEYLLAAWRSARPVIAAVLAGAYLLADVDDVHQETFLRVCERWDRFDPARGDAGVFIRGIGKSAAQDHVRKRAGRWAREKCLDIDLLLKDEASLSVVESGSVASEVLGLLRIATGATDYFRAVATALWFDGNAVAAAKAWGLSKQAVQDSRMRVRRIGKVIVRALVEREQRVVHGVTEPVSVATLAACLPSDAGKLAYLEALAAADSVEKLSTARLVELTGLPHNSVNKHSAATKKLLSIARSVVETGTLAGEK